MLEKASNWADWGSGVKGLPQITETFLLLQPVLQQKVRNGTKRGYQSGISPNTFTKFRFCYWEIVCISCVLWFPPGKSLSVLADCILSRIKAVCLLGFRLFRRLNIERYQRHPSVAPSTMSSFHPLDRISLSGRCKHLNIWKVHDQANFSLCYYYYYFQSAGRSWLSLSGGLGAPTEPKGAAIWYNYARRFIWLTVWISFTFEFKFPSLLMKLCFFYGLFFPSL